MNYDNLYSKSAKPRRKGRVYKPVLVFKKYKPTKKFKELCVDTSIFRRNTINIPSHGLLDLPSVKSVIIEISKCDEDSI